MSPGKEMLPCHRYPHATWGFSEFLYSSYPLNFVSFCFILHYIYHFFFFICVFENYFSFLSGKFEVWPPCYLIISFDRLRKWVFVFCMKMSNRNGIKVFTWYDMILWSKHLFSQNVDEIFTYFIHLLQLINIRLFICWLFQ